MADLNLTKRRWFLRFTAGSSTVVISIERMDTLLHICATFRGGKYKQKVCMRRLLLPHEHPEPWRRCASFPRLLPPVLTHVWIASLCVTAQVLNLLKAGNR